MLPLQASGRGLNRNSGLRGLSAEASSRVFSKSVREVQTPVGSGSYLSTSDGNEINCLERQLPRETDVESLSALGGGGFSEFNYNLSVEYASSWDFPALRGITLPAAPSRCLCAVSD